MGHDVDRAERRRQAGRGIAWFLLLFCVYGVIGHFLLGTSWITKGFVTPWTHLNVRSAVTLARPLGLDIQPSGTQMLMPDGVILDAKKGCDGTAALLILSATILAFPAPWRSRLLGLLIGAVAIFAINAIRIMTLLLIGAHWPQWLQVFHVDVWQPVMVLISFGLFLVWGTWLAGESPTKIPRG